MALQFPRYLPLISIAVTCRMKWGGVIQQHASGSEGRLSYQSEPTWEYDLTFNGLRDGFWGGNAYDELSQIEGLFGACQGTTLGFAFHDKRRDRAFRQYLGTTDGSTTTFDLLYTYGAPSNSSLQGTEHIGFLDQSDVQFALYIDTSNVPVRSDDATYGYALNTATPGKQQIVFNSAPANGHKVYADIGFQYYARFSESPLEYDRLLWNLYEAQKITICTLRAESL